MAAEFLNIIQVLTDNTRLSFPATYPQLQLMMVIPYLIFLFFPKPVLHNATHLRKVAWVCGGVILLVSLAQGAAWDNFGASKGVWIFDSSNMIGHIGAIPIEEYFFILNDMLLATLFTLRLWTWRTSLEYPLTLTDRMPGRSLRLGVMTLLVVLGPVGWVMLYQGKNEYLFLAIILGFFAPFLALQWWFCHTTFIRHWKIWIASWGITGVYTYLLDCIAVNQGIWVFDYRYTTNTWVFGHVNAEVLVIYVLACLVVASPLLHALVDFETRQTAASTPDRSIPMPTGIPDPAQTPLGRA